MALDTGIVIKGWLAHLLHSRSAQDLEGNKEGTKGKTRGQEENKLENSEEDIVVCQFLLGACCKMVGVY